MSRKEIFTLKLQMGIDPSTKIEPNIMRAMWQQLTFESVNAQRTRSSKTPRPIPVTTNPMVI
jgi:hypothetical protein